MTPAQRERARTELLVAGNVLNDLSTLVSQGRELYDTEADRRAHVRNLWIVVGSRLKNSSAVLAAPRASGRLAHAIGLRQKLAYTAPQRINDDLVWRTSEDEAPELTAEISATVEALR